MFEFLCRQQNYVHKHAALEKCMPVTWICVDFLQDWMLWLPVWSSSTNEAAWLESTAYTWTTWTKNSEWRCSVEEWKIRLCWPSDLCGWTVWPVVAEHSCVTWSFTELQLMNGVSKDIFWNLNHFLCWHLLPYHSELHKFFVKHISMLVVRCISRIAKSDC